MLDEKKVRLMTKMAMYEQKHGASDFRISAYYKKDYKSLNMILSWIYMTIGYIVLVGLVCATYLEEIVSNMTVSGIIMMLLSVLTIYLVLVIIYVIGTNAFYDKKHRNYEDGLKHVDYCVTRLALFYLKHSVLDNGSCTHKRKDKHKRVSAKIIGGLRAPEGESVSTEHRTDIGDSSRNSVCAKDRKAYKNEKPNVNIREYSRYLLKEFVEEELFKHKKYCKEESPNNKRPVGTMPEARKKPNYKGVEKPTPL